jgi:hypothetical protein
MKSDKVGSIIFLGGILIVTLALGSMGMGISNGGRRHMDGFSEGPEVNPTTKPAANTPAKKTANTTAKKTANTTANN